MIDQRVQISEKLQKLGKENADLTIKSLVKRQAFNQNLISTPFLNFDFSKQKISSESFEWLLTVPDQLNLGESFSKLIEGTFENQTEKRKVSHTLYRLPSSKMTHQAILTERDKFKMFLRRINLEKNIKNLICIGIGGSRLGPELLNQFQEKERPFNIYFCSSLDLLELKSVLQKCSQAETYVVASSKSFRTLEVLKNLEFLADWFKKIPELEFIDHLFAVSSNKKAMDAFGIKKENQFHILESLGGRYSLWSSISLPAFINSGFDSYLNFLEGASLADKHVLESEWKNNISMIMALLSIWNTSALRINNHGIFTYNYRLRSFMQYISQLSMESNGKLINSDSVISPFYSSPLIWGGYGIDSQHSTFQWMMQSKTLTSNDFIGLNDESFESKDSYQVLLSQVLALTFGEKNEKEPFKSVLGENPCSIIQLHSLDLKTLGFLIAIYEHKTFFEGLILGVESFDQWGVQLGKKLALKAKHDQEFLGDFFSSNILPKS